MTALILLLCNLFISAAGVERVDAVDVKVSAAADASGAMETTSVAADNVHLAASVGLVSNDILDDQNASIEEGQKSQTFPLGMDDQAEAAAADCREFLEVEATEVEEPPGTPASLPSLISEPEDTCTPVKFLKVGYLIL